MIKKIIRSVLFISGLALILTVSSIFMAPKKDIYNVSAFEHKVNDLEGEKDNTIDVVFLGDSEVYSAYSPLQMYHEYGFTSYICATSAQRLCDTYAMVQEIYKTQQPKVVVIETNCFFRYGGMADETGDKVMDKVLDYVPAMKYKSKFKTVFYPGIDKEESSMKGFRYRTDINSYHGGKWMHESEQKEDIRKVNLDYFKKIYNYIIEQGSEVVFVTTPSPDCHDYKKHNAMKYLAKEYGLEYYDLNLVSDEIGIDWINETRDGGNHLNYAGAEKVTSYFGNILDKEHELPDHIEDAEYSGWDEAFEKYAEKVGYNKEI
jgi:hypothetical protein